MVSCMGRVETPRVGYSDEDTRLGVAESRGSTGCWFYYGVVRGHSISKHLHLTKRGAGVVVIGPVEEEQGGCP